ncbi:MAG: hypothetical protein DRN30_04540, partial [Thermoplasmata archaeon]
EKNEPVLLDDIQSPLLSPEIGFQDVDQGFPKKNPKRTQTISEDIFGALEKPGSASRASLYKMFSDDEDLPGFVDIMKGRRTFTARELIRKIEDDTGRDLTFGPRDSDEQTNFEGFVNGVNGFLLDIGTSPETYVGFGPQAVAFKTIGKLIQKAGKNPKFARKFFLTLARKAGPKEVVKKKALRHMAEGLTKTQATRAAVGGTIGGLTIDEGDTVFDAFQSIVTGGAAGAFLLPSLRMAGKGLSSTATTGLDGAAEVMLKDSLKRIRGSKAAAELVEKGVIKKTDDLKLSTLFTQSNKARKKSKEIGRLFMEKKELAEREIVGDWIRAGVPKNKIQENLLLFEKFKAGKLSGSTEIRNRILKHFRETRPFRGKNAEVTAIEAGLETKLASQITNKMMNLKTFGRASSRPSIARARVNPSSTGRNANVLSRGELKALKGVKDNTLRSLINADAIKKGAKSKDILDNPLMESALRRHVAMNRDLVANATRRYKGSGREELIFAPLDFHMTDLKTVGDDALKFSESAIKEGARLRKGDAVEYAADEVTRQLSKDIGANKYAAMLLSKNQLVGRRGMVDIYSAINNASLRKGVAEGNGIEISKSLFKWFGTATNLVKTNQLLYNTSWLKGNYIEGVTKAYMAAGSRAALDAAIQLPVGLAKAALKKMKVIKQTDDMKSLSSLDSSALVDDMLKAQSMKTRLNTIIPYGLDFPVALAKLGVIENSQAANFVKRMVDDDLLIAKFKEDPSTLLKGSKIKGVTLESTKDGLNAIQKYSDFMWSGPVARLARATEDSMRMITYKHVLQSLKHKFPGFDKVLNSNLIRGKHSRILALTDEHAMKGIKRTLSKEEFDFMLRRAVNKEVESGGPLSMSKYNKVKKTVTNRFNSINNAGAEARMERLRPVLRARELMEEAANKTNNAFFSYDEVSAAEEFIAKKIFPYWTYATRSVDYWADKFFTPEGIRRISLSAKVPANLGRPLDEDERRALPDYMRKQLPRVSADGSSLRSLPQFPLLDTINKFDSMNSVLKQLSPLIQVPASILSDTDFLRERKLTPNEERQPVVKISPSKETLITPDSILAKMNIFENKMKDGYVTNSARSKQALTFSRGLLSMGFLDQMAKAVEQTKKDPNFQGVPRLDAATFAKKLFKETLSPVKEREVERRGRIMKRSKAAKKKKAKFDADSRREILKGTK